MSMTRRIRAAVSALVACLVLCCLAAVPAFAADGLATQTKPITVTNLQVDGDNQPTVSVYRIINVNYKTDTASDAVDGSGQVGTPAYYWDNAIAEKLSADENLKKWVATATTTLDNITYYGVADDFMKSENSTQASAVYDQIRAWIGLGEANGGIDLEPVSAPELQVSDAGTTATASYDATMGGYLIDVVGGPTYVYQTMVRTVYPAKSDNSNVWVLSAPEATVTAKNSVPGITKTVADADHLYYDTVGTQTGGSAVAAAIGDTLTYTVTLSVPTYTSGATNTTLELSDVFGTGLTYVNGSLSVTSGSAQLADDAYTFTYANIDGEPTPGDGKTTTLNVAFDYSKVRGYNKITVSYTALVNGDMTVETPSLNTAKLTYANNPFDSEGNETITTTTTTYTYGMRVYKVNESNQPLQGAKFCVIVPLDGATTGTSAQALKFTKTTDTTGKTVYKVAGVEDVSVEAGVAGVTEDAKVESGKDGYIYIEGLDEGNYTLKEVEAPSGYLLPTGYFATDELRGASASGVLNGDTTSPVDGLPGYIGKTVTNTSNNLLLPITGGTGTVMFAAAGVLVLAVGVGMVVRLRNRDRESA